MNKYKKWVPVAVFLFLSVGTFLLGYAQHQQKKSKPLSLIYIPKTEDGTNDFWTSLIFGARMAAKEYGADSLVTGPEAEQDVKQQNELLRAAIKKKPDAILFSPSSFTESDELLKEAKEQGTHITFIDSYTEEEIQQFISTKFMCAVVQKLTLETAQQIAEIFYDNDIRIYLSKQESDIPIQWGNNCCSYSL